LEEQKTRLSSDVAADAVNSTVENNVGFAADDYVVFGTLGEELTEIVKLTSVSTTVTLGHTTGPVFAHSARTPVAQIKYNQVKIYTDTAEDGLFTTLLTTIDLTPDQDETVYDDDAGTVATWYKIKYYNEVEDNLSAFSVPVLGTGYTEDSLFSMTEEVMEEFGDTGGKDLTKDEVHRHLRAGVRRLAADLYKVYPDYFRTYTTQALTASDYDYTLPTGFLGFIRVDVNYDGSTATDAYKAEYISEAFGEPETSYYKTGPMIAIRGSTFILRPTPDSTGGYAFMWYWAYPTAMTEENDEHGLPYGARDVLISYALYKIWTARTSETGAGTRAYSYRQLFNESKESYVEFVASSRQQINSTKIGLAFGEDLYE
jgi:hypothetical protein